MSRPADAYMMEAVALQLNNLQSLHAVLRSRGNREVADAVQRAIRELQHPAVSGAMDQAGVAFDVTSP